MVVDDNPNFSQTVKDNLEARGFVVNTAGSDEEAINKAKERPHDIILIDAKVPPVNGLFIYLELKKVNPDAVAIMMTAYKEEMSHIIEQAIKKGVYAAIHKPFSIDKIVKIIEEIVEKKRKKIGMSFKILVVDDNVNSITTLTDLFEEDGYTVVVAADGEEALKKAQEEKPDIILLDIRLPGMDGYDVCRQIKEIKGSNIKVIMYTAYVDVVDIVKAKEAGADDFIGKTSDFAQMRRSIEKLIAQCG